MRSASTRTQEELPPPLELTVLNVLWRVGEASVATVREEMHPSRPLAYTTVMTILDRLVKRGVVERRKLGRSFQYKPVVLQSQMRNVAVRQLLERFFDGSTDLLQQFLRDGDLPDGASLLSTSSSEDDPSPSPTSNSPSNQRPLDAALL